MNRRPSGIRCLFVLPSLRGGGAERVVTVLLERLSRSGRSTSHRADQLGTLDPLDLHLALVEKTGPNIDYLPDGIEVHDLQAGRVARAIVPLVRLIRRLQPEIVFSTISHLNLAAAMTRHVWPARTRFILRETATCQHILGSAARPKLRRCLYAHFYPAADAIICQTPFMRCDLQRDFRLPASKLYVIPNPVDFDEIDQLKTLGDDRLVPGGSDYPRATRSVRGDARPICERRRSPTSGQWDRESGPHVVSIGRLRPVKGTWRVISAFPHLLRRRSDAHLWLLGDGPCETSLRRQAADLRIADRVHFAGYQANPYAWLHHADLMVLGSHNESSPNSILEAVACGCPPVAVRHCGGTYEMLSHLGLGNRFVSALDRWDDRWFEQLPDTAVRQARNRYDADQVAVQYRRLFEKLIS